MDSSAGSSTPPRRSSVEGCSNWSRCAHFPYADASLTAQGKAQRTGARVAHLECGRLQRHTGAQRSLGRVEAAPPDPGERRHSGHFGEARTKALWTEAAKRSQFRNRPALVQLGIEPSLMMRHVREPAALTDSCRRPRTLGSRLPPPSVGMGDGLAPSKFRGQAFVSARGLFEAVVHRTSWTLRAGRLSVTLAWPFGPATCTSMRWVRL